MAVILILLNEQILSKFLENSSNVGKFLKNFEANSKNFWSNFVTEDTYAERKAE